MDDLLAIHEHLKERDEKGQFIVRNYTLMRDLDLSGVNWESIGSSKDPFIGTFDGNGCTISNLTIINGSGSKGLFNYVTKSTIRDLYLVDANVEGGREQATAKDGRLRATHGCVRIHEAWSLFALSCKQLYLFSSPKFKGLNRPFLL